MNKLRHFSLYTDHQRRIIYIFIHHYWDDIDLTTLKENFRAKVAHVSDRRTLYLLANSRVIFHFILCDSLIRYYVHRVLKSQCQNYAKWFQDTDDWVRLTTIREYAEACPLFP